MNLKINSSSPISSCVRYKFPIIKKQTDNQKILKFRGHNVMKNSNLGLWNKMLFIVSDKISAIFWDNPQIVSRITSLSAKMVRNTGSLSKYDVVL